MNRPKTVRCTPDLRLIVSRFRFRAGRMTASRMKAACRTSSEAPLKSLVKDICHPAMKRFSTSATRWGCQHEKTAEEQYQHQMKDIHENFKLRDCGFIISPKYPFIGASPDGIASCDCCDDVILEVKCPHCQRDPAITDTVDCLETRDRQLSLKQSHAYFYQVQCQLLLSSAECCDFVIWTRQDFFSERIFLDEQFCQEMITKSSILFPRIILPELVGKLFSRPSPLSSLPLQTSNIVKPSNSSNEESICVCKSAYKETDDVIGCDNENCPYVWLHFKCVKLKKVPKEEWFCRECKSKM